MEAVEFTPHCNQCKQPRRSDCDGTGWLDAIEGPDIPYVAPEPCPQLWTVEKLIAFEQDIANEFNAGKIRAPIHLDGGNEVNLIHTFKHVQAQDWVCGSWRMHYKCLLKGVLPEQLKAAIMEGRSITLCFPEHRIISSAIVGGILPIALGLAMSVRQRGGNERVHCFLGDMTAHTGMFHEVWGYAVVHGLNGYPTDAGSKWLGGPLHFVMEDNGLSVATPTEAVWPAAQPGCIVGIGQYKYKLPWPHSGAGKRVEF